MQQAEEYARLLADDMDVIAQRIDAQDEHAVQRAAQRAKLVAAAEAEGRPVPPEALREGGRRGRGTGDGDEGESDASYSSGDEGNGYSDEYGEATGGDGSQPWWWGSRLRRTIGRSVRKVGRSLGRTMGRSQRSTSRADQQRRRTEAGGARKGVAAVKKVANAAAAVRKGQQQQGEKTR